MDLVFWIFSYFLFGFLLGISISIVGVILTWQDGYDITLHDLSRIGLILVLLTLFWPVIGIGMLAQWLVRNWNLNKNTVILRGSRSVKTFRALRDKDST